MKVKVYAYQVADSHGNKWVELVSDVNVEVSVWGLKDIENYTLHFEAEAYHLENWCKENDLDYKCEELEITLPF